MSSQFVRVATTFRHFSASWRSGTRRLRCCKFRPDVRAHSGGNDGFHRALLHFLRLNVTVIISLLLPSLPVVAIVITRVSLSLSSSVLLYFVFGPSIPGPSPVEVRTLPALS